MKKLINDYWKVGIFYIVIVVGVLGINARFEMINERIEIETVVIAEND